MLFSYIGLCMTQRCSAACDICCFSCSPASTSRMSHEALRFHIQDAAGHPQIKSVGFTGGEALLYYEEVLELCQYANSLGMITIINTNGFWGEDPKLWKRRLLALREAGVRKIFFSTDPSHQRFVPVHHLRQALEMTRDLELKYEVNVLEKTGSGHREELASLLGPEWSEALRSVPLLRAGRAAKGIIPLEDFPAFCAPEDAGCFFDKVLHVNYDGNIYMCCSQFSREIPALIVGRTGETSVQEAYQAMVRNDVTYLLLRRGPGWFYKQAVSRGLISGRGPVHSCQLCRDLIGDAALLEQLGPDIQWEAQALRLESFFARLRPSGKQ